MGTCCSSRTDVDGKDKNAKSAKSSSTASKTTTGKDTAVKFSPLDEVRNSLNQAIRSGPNNDTLVVTMAQSSFADFMKDIKSTLTLIQNQTKKVFLPISLSHSPVNPSEDIVVVFRASESVQCFSLENWFTEDITKLSTKFVTKSLPVDKDIGSRAKIMIQTELKSFYTKENLGLIGGFQDSKGTLQLLFFKENTTAQVVDEDSIFAEILQQDGEKSAEDQRHEVEELIN
jgi:hypothetical protein